MKTSQIFSSNVFDILQPNYSKSYLISHPSKFIRLKNYVAQNLPIVTKNKIEDALKMITQKDDKIHKDNMVILYEKVELKSSDLSEKTSSVVNEDEFLC